MIEKKNIVAATDTDAVKAQFKPLAAEYLTVDKPLDQDVYCLTDGQYVIYKKATQVFTLQDKARLAHIRAKLVYVYLSNPKDMLKVYEQLLPNIIDNPAVPVKEKAEVLYECATGIAQEIFENPRSKQMIGRSKEVVNNTINLLSKSSDAFLEMISLSSHDYYTYTHCVNVMTFTISVLSSLGVKDPQTLKDAGIGALLHDVGKSKVPLSVLNKPGPLSADEWSIMKRHPQFGIEMLSNSPVPEAGKQIIVQHHEKISGFGYPLGLRGEAVGITSQVVSLCDAYDAMTTNRVYQKAMSPFEAFKIITQQMHGHFDLKIVQKFIHLLNLKEKV